MYEICNNFLDTKTFNELRDLIISNRDFPWFHELKVNDFQNNESLFSYFTHTFYLKNAINSNRYDNVLPFLEKLEIKALIRVVANLYVKTDKIETHPFHIDYEFPHKGALLSLNTCNGGTILKNNKKIKSVENTVIFFDPSKPHASTSATDVKGRFNILVNYF
jgi:hypothetical protein|tara:strand:+ start:576 stop:1064 length:489 start_codon:yes stop_codon:yes gene_type:complete